MTLFTLSLGGIYFVKGLPIYPDLFDYGTLPTPENPPSLQMEVGLRILEPGPFEVQFSLDTQETDLSFVTATGTSVIPLYRVGAEAVEDPGWSASASPDGKTCHLVWGDGQSPPYAAPTTQVLRINCREGAQSRRLFVVIINTPPEEIRQNPSEPLPLPPADPPVLQLGEVSNHFRYEVFQAEAVSDLEGKAQFEPVIRVAQKQKLQFALFIDSTSTHQFLTGAGADQVPVRLYLDEENHSALRPTLRPDPETCIVTWQADAAHPAPTSHFLPFNLMTQVAPGINAPHRRVDPTVIEDPYVPPPDPPGPGNGEPPHGDGDEP
ncbi:MAG: hypothetical protein SX243_16260 [Acidobacteriota bacterium]|nr:hypothetical protein [Acidobacteriota bacterium]